jgi:hypothetical protein
MPTSMTMISSTDQKLKSPLGPLLSPSGIPGV